MKSNYYPRNCPSRGQAFTLSRPPYPSAPLIKYASINGSRSPSTTASPSPVPPQHLKPFLFRIVPGHPPSPPVHHLSFVGDEGHLTVRINELSNAAQVWGIPGPHRTKSPSSLRVNCLSENFTSNSPRMSKVSVVEEPSGSQSALVSPFLWSPHLISKARVWSGLPDSSMKCPRNHPLCPADICAAFPKNGSSNIGFFDSLSGGMPSDMEQSFAHEQNPNMEDKTA